MDKFDVINNKMILLGFTYYRYHLDPSDPVHIWTKKIVEDIGEFEKSEFIFEYHLNPSGITPFVLIGQFRNSLPINVKHQIGDQVFDYDIEVIRNLFDDLIKSSVDGSNELLRDKKDQSDKTIKK